MNDFAPAKDFRLPDATKRAVVLGRTGSGKTLFMRWLLSVATIETMPWIIFDYKQAGDFSDIPFAQKIEAGYLPKMAGVYIVEPTFSDEEQIDNYLFNILRHGNIGVMFDEGASIPQREPRFLGLKTVLAQGRGKRVPVIFGSQRPRHINKSLLSEGDFFALFHLSYQSDVDAVREFMPKRVMQPLDDFHSYWYDVRKDKLFVLGPVNDDDTLERFENRLQPRRRMY